MCWRFTVTVPPHCAKGAGWWAESTAAVQSQTRWWFALGWWVSGYPSFPYCNYKVCPCQQTKKQTSSLSCWFPSCPPLWSAVPGHSPAKASLCSWKNNLNGKLQSGLLRSSLFLAHLYENPHSKKENWEKHKLHLLHKAGTKHYVMLRLLPVTIGRANSTKSSMRTGHAPEETEKHYY